MSKLIKDIVIVGGGTAGWLTAGLIAARHDVRTNDKLTITLVESPNVPIVGVGEGTWPTMRNTLRSIGISETEFIRECDATFKQGACFTKWVTGDNDDYYYHPLELPQGFVSGNLAPHWLESDNGESFADAVSTQSHLCELGLAPKLITTPEYASIANYAYHLDAGKFASFLQKHCVDKLGVKHILADVTSIENDQQGHIEALVTAQVGRIDGDFFIDCTGFQSLLLGQHYQVPFESCNEVLFVDSALAVHAPYEAVDTPIATHTISTGQRSGWIWDIGLTQRRGVGYVYSSGHTTDEKAEQELRNYLRPRVPKVDDLDVRKIPIKSGHRSEFWHKNVVAVGLSAGFLEPLEASSLVLVELSAQFIADQLPPNNACMDIVAKRFNERTHYRWDRIIDFLKLHYCLTKRTDTEFWIDNCRPESIPESLQELLKLWKYQCPWQEDFAHKDEVFPSASYQYVLYGMQFKTVPSFHGVTEANQRFAEEQFRENRKKRGVQAQHLPEHRSLLNKIHEFGLQTV